jgi:hypothetical protein
MVSSSTVVNIFNGTNWSTIGNITGGSGVVEDVCPLGNNLYVGGVFTGAGGVSTAGLAKWDGVNWSNVGGSAFPVVYALATDGTNLYVGGSFTNAGGITNLAKWDGTNWSNVGGGIGYYLAGITPSVNAIVWRQGQLYIGGNFTNAGNVAVTNLARFDGISWSAIGGAAGGASDVVQDLKFLGNDLYIAGQFTTVAGVSALNIARWNGSVWTALGSGLKAPPGTFVGAPGNAPVNGIDFLGSDLYAAGTFTNAGGVKVANVARWNGSAWSDLGGVNGSGNHVISNSGSIYISGAFNLASNSVIVNHIARYDGSGWHGVTAKPALGTHTFVQALALGPDGLYLGGVFNAVGGTPASRIARYDGTNWFPVGVGITNPVGGSLDVRCIKAANSLVYVSGNFSSAGSATSTNIAAWNGTSWSSLGAGLDAPAVAMDSSGSDLYVGGGFTSAYLSPGVPLIVNHIAHWNGTAWSAVGGGLSNSANAICISGGNVYVGGSFTNAGGVAANRIAVWNGSVWSSLGTGTENGLNSTVNAILVDGANVYVGGQFTNAGSVVTRGIAKWNGSAWSALGQGIFGNSTPTIRALAKIGTYLYAAGTFTNVGGMVNYNIARWDGSQWLGMGSGVGINIGATRASNLATWGNDLYVGGIFEDAGGGDAGFLAHWNDQIDFTPPATMRISAPQMFSGSAFKLHLTASDRAAYVVEYSTNLQSWTAFATNSLNAIDVTNIAFGAPYRLYRMREIP